MLTTIKTDLLRAHLPVTTLSSKDEGRYYLHGVLVEFTTGGLRMVSTDGHIMLVTLDDTDACDAHDSVILDHWDLKKALTGYKEKTVDLKFDDKHCLINGVQVALFYNNYPDYRRVIPDNISGEPAQYAPKYVAAISKSAKTLTGSDNLYIKHNGNNAALVPMSAYGFGVIMPVRAAYTEEAEAAVKAICSHDLAEAETTAVAAE